MPMFMDQYRAVFPNTKFDATMVIKSHILPIVMKMSNKNYNAVMRVPFKLQIMFANVSYDDLLDRFLFMEYEKII